MNVTQKKLLIGLLIVTSIVTVTIVTNISDTVSIPPLERDPDDPGDNPGPGFGSIINDIPYSFTVDATQNLT